MQTLVLVAHPHLADSTTQQFFKASLPADGVTYRVLDQRDYDVSQEQAALRQADRIILQFPLYWYAAPASLKHWEDTVLTRTFVYGDHRYPLADKELGIVVTTGMPAQAFRRGGTENVTLDALMAPLAALAHRAKMSWLPIFAVHQFNYLDEPQKLRLVVAYQRYLTQSAPDTLANRQAWFAARLPEKVAQLKPADQTTGRLIATTVTQQVDTLAELMATLAMIKEQDDD
ncbi:NAD(P)H-dependent oxidoreductase [Levilactobacillus zymae]|uniref:NAD(P)H-dependent oxidoreductase n=1 Tax=Levilactobacillus zymae TaxID=267363 RepID=UPI0028BACD9D|nr:NAD(P)H-dependent oxidoreductase [Levilactobacillus zymae]MDT6981280.1 NAD(P)H-dependent oxidoreductase [Levilactobacillus zymae]